MLQFLNMTKFIFNRSNSLLIRNDQMIQYINFLQHQINLYSSRTYDTESNETKQKQKTPRVSKITLVHPDKSISVTLLDAAERLAKRRNFNLIKVLDNDSKNNRSVYELVSPSSYKIQHKNERKGADKNFTKIKSTKVYTINPKINEYDLYIKIRKINEALNKQHKIKIILNNANDEDRTKLMKIIEQEVKGNMQKEKSQKECNMFLFLPLSNDESTSLNNDIDNITEPQNETK